MPQAVHTTAPNDGVGGGGGTASCTRPATAMPLARMLPRGIGGPASRHARFRRKLPRQRTWFFVCFCDGFRMTAHLRRCHEHWGRRPKAAKEGKRGEWGSSGAAGSMEIWRREVVLRAGHFPPPPGLTRTTFSLWHGPC
jgi:hypothetical protein